jgi:hypothetical protein
VIQTSRTFSSYFTTVISTLLILAAGIQGHALQEVLVDEKVLERARVKYGADAVEHINALQSLIKNDDSKSDAEKL